MSKFLYTEVEMYTTEGMELFKTDEEAAKDMTEWVGMCFQIDFIISFKDSHETPGKTQIQLSTGLHYKVNKSPLEFAAFLSKAVKHDDHVIYYENIEKSSGNL